jgi:hypothetical protein
MSGQEGKRDPLGREPEFREQLLQWRGSAERVHAVNEAVPVAGSGGEDGGSADRRRPGEGDPHVPSRGAKTVAATCH